MQLLPSDACLLFAKSACVKVRARVCVCSCLPATPSSRIVSTGFCISNYLHLFFELPPALTAAATASTTTFSSSSSRHPPPPPPQFLNPDAWSTSPSNHADMSSAVSGTSTSVLSPPTATALTAPAASFNAYLHNAWRPSVTCVASAARHLNPSSPLPFTCWPGNHWPLTSSRPAMQAPSRSSMTSR